MPKPPTPTNVLKHRGSWRGKSRPKEPRPKRAIPTAPGHLDLGGKNVWRRVAKILQQMKVLTEADRDLLAEYCQAEADIGRYQRFLRKNGETYTLGDSIRRRPETIMLREARERLIKLGNLFGLSPSYRAKVQVVDEPEATDDKGKFFE